MAGTPIDRNNLPKGVTIDPNTGRYLITNEKGQTTRVGADNLEQLNNYNSSWQTGKPTEATITRLDGTTKTETFNPPQIQTQQKEVVDYETNRQNLKKAGLFDNGDGTYSERRQNENFNKPISADEAKQRLAAVGAAPSTATVEAKPTPPEVKASTETVNTVTNEPSNLNPAPSTPESGSLNSPLNVDSAVGATIVKDSENPIIQTSSPETLATGESIIESPPVVDPGTSPGTPPPPTVGTVENYSPPPADEFDGIDAQVADQKAIMAAENISTFQDPAQAQQAAFAAASADPTTTGNPLAQDPAQRGQAAATKAALPLPPKDWRFRISLARGATNYFYNDPGQTILSPLKQTGGVIFPYTPTVQVAYSAAYDSQQIVHSNFKTHNYTGSSVDSVTVTGDFTAQDATEAAYLLAVIHFFRSATKMFYGQDQNPAKGIPPPLLYLTGFGTYQFDNHPVVLTNFNYSLPNDVDYINAYPDGVSSAVNGVSLTTFTKPNFTKPNSFSSVLDRLQGSGLRPNAQPAQPNFRSSQPATNEVTRVPTKITISLSFLPIVTRNAINTQFSLQKYASGKLLRGSQNPGTGGGIW